MYLRGTIALEQVTLAEKGDKLEIQTGDASAVGLRFDPFRIHDNKAYRKMLGPTSGSILVVD